MEDGVGLQEDGELGDWLMCSCLCGCGKSEAAAELMRDVLRQLDAPDRGSPKYREFWDTRYDELKELLPTDGIYYGYLYLLDGLGLEEHGGCTPGWLTAKGKKVLAFLEKYGTDNDYWPEQVAIGREPLRWRVPVEVDPVTGEATKYRDEGEATP